MLNSELNSANVHHFTLSIILSFHFLFFGAIVAPPLAAPPFLKV
jgi:hypothetical protein